MTEPDADTITAPVADKLILTAEEAAEFWSKVTKPDGENGCWIWTGYLVGVGYGGMRLRRKCKQAHRISFEMHRRLLLPGECACHDCPGGDNMRCVNPAHLWAGTVGQNNSDRHAKGRSRPLRGEQQPTAKLTKEKVLRILALSAEGKGCTELGKMFSVTKGCISHIKSRRQWRHVTLQPETRG